MDPQERALQAGVDIVVATPGRLMDHMRHGTPDFVRLQVLVLDEADRMMDMGFWPDVQQIMSALPPDRQTLLFSATMPGEILQLATEMLRDAALRRQVGGNGGAARTITHRSEQSTRGEKLDWLATFLDRTPTARCWCSCARRSAPIGWRVSCRRRASAPRRCTPIASQQERMAAVEGFRCGQASACWSPPTSPRAASTSTASRTSSTSKCRRRPRPTCTASAAPAGDRRRAAITLVAPEEQRAWRAGEAVGLQLQ